MMCSRCGIRERAYPRTVCQMCRNTVERERRQLRAESAALKPCSIDGCPNPRYRTPSQTLHVCQMHWNEHYQKKDFTPKVPATKERVRAQNRASQDRHRIRRRYGIDYAEEYARCGGVCEICSLPFDALQVDHNHATGLFRGMLCGNCNKVLGFALDNPALLRAAADYLEERV